MPPRLPRNKGGVGTLGRPIKLFTNFFPVKFDRPDRIVYHFDVVIRDLWGEKDDQHRKGDNGAPGSAAAAAPLPVGVAEPKKKGRKRRGKSGPKPKEGTEGEGAAEEASTSESGATAVVPAGDTPVEGQDRKIPRDKSRRIFTAFITDRPRVNLLDSLLLV